ncbi:DNA-binding transcriptional regulator GbsR (MarR family) [Nonlabens xylanidelens]|uniref:HTH-type transcriptional regulator n=1 Tax=Nonlabens xylanidelens TaxID=191564 RepID=A0A2S6IPY5_9FLAO|nr:transcriptional regulator [Nonlabens xylanidelens]PPK96231.1 DNA-binding transcriptional regulator GbsR (MarR family) [Nonlabens xylanidelens]PQJ17970.1 transcriptional regulator [Nonlabens xylanidelens]
MKLEEGRSKFIQAWGSLGSSWGISKSMAQIHALLLSYPEGLSADEIMEQVQLSRGNVNTNVRELINWRLVRKETVLGERKEFFVALHDVHTISQNIMEERKRRELEPVRRLLNELKAATLEGKEEDVKHFQSLLSDLADFVSQMENLTNLMTKINNNNYMKKLIKAIS